MNKKFVGQYSRYPDKTMQRITEGGIRLKQLTEKNTSKTPLVSIITIVYNAADLLEETIKSVLSQTYKNIEYIIIDGASKDKSLEIILKYASQINYYISEPDQGIYHAMNKGISLAMGDYICLLNAGDYYHNMYIEKSLETALHSRADIVFSAMKWNGIDRYPNKINSGILLHHLNINHMTFLVSKRAYETVGPYSEDFKLFSDDLWTRTAYQKKVNFVYLPELLVVFSGGGLSNGDSEEKKKAIFYESGTILKIFFPFLTMNEAEKLILTRFRIDMIDVLLEIYNKYSDHEFLFRDAMANYIEFLLLKRENYIFNEEKSIKFLRKYKSLALNLNISLSTFRFKIKSSGIKRIFSNIDKLKKVLSREENKKSTRVLHFASQFSSPSETFIYDLILRMDKDVEKQNVVLCDNRLLENERPFESCIDINWESMLPPVRELLYTHLFNVIQPDVIVAHFALNGWKLHQRISSLDIKTPIVHMTHGIDVFTINTKVDYGLYIQKQASIDPRCRFTAVSKYLKTSLIERGVEENRITIVPNVVHERFFLHRKTTDFYNANRILRILNVGRLIPLKGHEELLEGLKYFIETVTDKVHLTIVYANDNSNLEHLEKKVNELGLRNYLTFVRYIDFGMEPDFYSKFDLFISASKYSEGKIVRSETFGMSTLEAIASGLPVIVTDAGGSPEVVGNEKIFAKIVPQANGIAIGKAIESMVKDGHCFKDNLQYAQERLTVFSAEEQLQKINNVLEEVMAKKLKVAIFSSMNQGGAGKATMRVHRALMMNNVESTLMTRDNNTILPPEPGYHYLSPEIGLEWETIQFSKHARSGNTIFSLNEPNLERGTLHSITQNMDIINLHWTARFLSAEDIGYLSNLDKPLVITVRDMHPMTGGCHFFHGCDRWKDDCYTCPQLVGDENHFPSKVFNIKKQYWNMKNITFVALSSHTKNIIKQSSLYQNNRIEIIGNPIDLELFSPTPKEQARKHFNLKQTTPFLFYMPSYGSRIKGSYEFKEALNYIKKKYPDFNLTLIFAGSAASLVKQKEFPFPSKHLGSFNNDKLLALAYSSANATIIPSLEETFSNTAAESISCGTPIIGFETGAIPEIAGDGLRGKSVPVGDILALGEAIYYVLSKPNLEANCRIYAENNFSFKKQGTKYAKLFNELKNVSKQTPLIKPDLIPLVDESICTEIYRWQAKTNRMKNTRTSIKQNKINKIGHKSTPTSRKEILELKEQFEDLCSISAFNNPLQKIRNYKKIIKTWHLIKHGIIQQVQDSDDIVNAFEDLTSVSLKKKPIKKLINYKNLIIVWHKFKWKLE